MFEKEVDFMERDRQKELEELKREYQKMKIPVEGYQKMKDAIDRAKMEKRRRARKICGNQE